MCIRDVNDLIEGIFLTFGGGVLLKKGFFISFFIIRNRSRHFFSFF